jgi:hypothetical protein
MRMWFVPDSTEIAEAARAFRSAVRRAGAAHDESLSPHAPEPPYFGEWEILAAKDGIVVDVAECDVFEAALPAVLADLQDRDLSGTLSVWKAPSVFLLPPVAPVLTCRVTVQGERVRKGPGTYGWVPDPAAYRAVLAAGVSWCRFGGAADRCTLRISSGGPVALGVQESVIDRLIESGGIGSVEAVSGRAFRAIALHAGGGRVSLLAGVLDERPGWWPTALQDLAEFLRAHAERLVYGYVMRGWDVDAARACDDLSRRDWPLRPRSVPLARGWTYAAFDDLAAPDVFGVQLLGAGFLPRVPQLADWHTTPVGQAVLLEHDARAEWFQAPSVPTGHFGAPAPPDLLVHSRDELASVLYVPGMLAQFGISDLPEHRE